MSFLSLPGKFIINSVWVHSSDQTLSFSNLLNLFHCGQANKFLNFGDIILKAEFWCFLWTFILCQINEQPLKLPSA